MSKVGGPNCDLGYPVAGNSDVELRILRHRALAQRSFLPVVRQGCRHFRRHGYAGLRYCDFAASSAAAVGIVASDIITFFFANLPIS